jgi:hypothetical protein
VPYSNFAKEELLFISKKLKEIQLFFEKNEKVLAKENY